MTYSVFGITARIRWYLAILEQSLTYSVIAALSVFMLWVGIALFVNPSLRQLRDETAMDVDSLTAQLALRSAMNAKSEAQFKAAPQLRFPSASLRDQQLMDLLGLLKKQGVTLERVDYKEEPLGKTDIRKLDIKMAMIGDIASQRRLIGMLRDRFENVSIEGIEYGREKGSDSKFLSKMNIVFYFSSVERP